MSKSTHVRRRILTGLTSYLDEPALQHAIRHWDAHYADRPATSLQKFVFEIAAEGELRAQRSNILLSLVTAMNLPESDLAKDSDSAAEKRSTAARTVPQDTASAAAFMVLMTTLMGSLNRMVQHSLRLDLLASLNNPKLPKTAVEPLMGWLNEGRPLRVEPQSAEVLRALVNRTYVLLCERIGPVEADKILAWVVDDAQERHPNLERAMTELL